MPSLHTGIQRLSGAEGIRTPDPLHAMEVRYQLRYSPLMPVAPDRQITAPRQCTRPPHITPPGTGPDSRHQGGPPDAGPEVDPASGVCSGPTVSTSTGSDSETGSATRARLSPALCSSRRQ